MRKYRLRGKLIALPSSTVCSLSRDQHSGDIPTEAAPVWLELTCGEKSSFLQLNLSPRPHDIMQKPFLWLVGFPDNRWCWQTPLYPHPPTSCRHKSTCASLCVSDEAKMMPSFAKKRKKCTCGWHTGLCYLLFPLRGNRRFTNQNQC